LNITYINNWIYHFTKCKESTKAISLSRSSKNVRIRNSN